VTAEAEHKLGGGARMARVRAVVGLYLAWAALGGLAVADAPRPIELKLWPGGVHTATVTPRLAGFP
jgi:hypothetical protein